MKHKTFSLHQWERFLIGTIIGGLRQKSYPFSRHNTGPSGSYQRRRMKHPFWKTVISNVFGRQGIVELCCLFAIFFAVPVPVSALECYRTTLNLTEPINNPDGIDQVVYDWTTEETSGNVGASELVDFRMILPKVAYVDTVLVAGVPLSFGGLDRTVGDPIWDFDLASLTLKQMRNYNPVLFPIANTTGQQFHVSDGRSIPDDGKVLIMRFLDGVQKYRYDEIVAAQSTVSTSCPGIPVDEPIVQSTDPIPDVIVRTTDGDILREKALAEADLGAVLTGDSLDPGGNIELGNASSAVTNEEYDQSISQHCIDGLTSGASIELCSLTAADWASDIDGNGQTLVEDFVDQGLVAYGLADIPGLKELVVEEFIANDGRQRFSDPNIAYINFAETAVSQATASTLAAQADTTFSGGEIRIGLAGFLDAKELVSPVLSGYEIGSTQLLDLLPDEVMISEAVKVVYNGEVSYHMSFNATPSGQSAANGSFTGNYEIMLQAPDTDADGVLDAADNCPLIANPGQEDYDQDGIGDACDADIDGDGVTNSSDLCPVTGLGEPVDGANGCSLDQLCPCEGPRGTSEAWRNHGQYVACVARTTQNFVKQDLITGNERQLIIRKAAQSNCGKGGE